MREPCVTPETVKIVPGEGMPLQKTPTQKGNMKVRASKSSGDLTEQLDSHTPL